MRRLYLMQVTLTMSKTNICVDERTVTSYVKNISILKFHTLGGFTLFSITKKIVVFCAGLCFTDFVPAVMVGHIQCLCLIESIRGSW